MKEIYDFFVAGRTRNKDKILEICDILDSLNVSYYCFLKNEESHKEAGLNLNDKPEDLMKKFESMDLDSEAVKIIFKHDMEGLKSSKNLLLVLP